MDKLPYDIYDNIIQYLDIDSSRNLLISSKEIYEVYRHTQHYESVMVTKIIKYFTSLTKLNIQYKTLSKEQKHELYNTLTSLYNYFKKHIDASISDFLVYLCDNSLSNNNLFELLISHCYFSKTGEYIYNAIRGDDLLYLLTFSTNVQLITTYIYVDPVILLHAIKYKISIKDRKNISYLLKYLLFKHFFRYSEYIEDVISEIVCELIKYNDISLLHEIYDKQKMYKFKLNYQMIINCCIQQKNIICLELIHSQMLTQNQLIRNTGRIPNPILITKESVRSLMKNKGYIILNKIIELYLKDMININGYFNEIKYNFDYTNKECLKLLDYLNNKNRNIITNRIK
jgi:hypothetical protein